MRKDEANLFIQTVSILLSSLYPYAEDDDSIEKIVFFRKKLEQIAYNEIRDNEEIREIFWDDFENFINELSLNSLMYKKVIANEEYPIVWGYWGYLEEHPSPYGYSEKHFEMLQGPANKSGRHIYRDRPKRVTLSLTPIIEGGQVRYYTTIAKICEIDAISSVPSIKHGMKIQQASQRILNPSIKMDEWQRELDAKRLLRISSFLDDEKNTFANPVMLFAPEHSSVEWIENSTGEYALELHIDFQFLVQDPKYKGVFLTDHRGSRDLRPLNIIDGQHRIRGGIRSERGSGVQVPIILFPSQLRNKGAAKFFAEINTLSEELHELHEIFMRHKFNLSSHVDKKKFGIYDGQKYTYRDRANRLSYEAAAYVNSHTPENISGISVGALHNLIKILSENPERNTIIDVNMWIQFSYPWFMPGGPHPPVDPEDDDSNLYFRQISNYFDAFCIISNKGRDMAGSIPSSKARWLTFESLEVDNRNGMKPFIQHKTTFRSLLVIYPRVVEIIEDEGYETEIITCERFQDILRLLGNIDWLDERIGNKYVKSGESGWKHLTQWMLDALERDTDVPFDEEEVMSDSISSERGKGLFSEVLPGEICLVDPEHNWPIPGRPVEIKVSRPINAVRICTANVYNENHQNLTRVTIGNKKGSANKETDTHIYKIAYSQKLNKCKKLLIICEWDNAMDRVSSTLELIR
ncbi:hypothetical protein OAJ13_01910 [Euryarchaeota archaeon]|nr:hypothetical protein [Euryarchaeota archaeon]